MREQDIEWRREELRRVVRANRLSVPIKEETINEMSKFAINAMLREMTDMGLWQEEPEGKRET